MRVLLVSAHYPPNFVSGGTLQPARLGRGLADEGHEVSVYAGWLDDDEPALATRETVEDGLAVHWIATSHFISWGDDRNWDNPDVTADFARVLRQVDPDVVHVHSLQGLGIGVVREAVTHRARVVVTMHDFWWFCPRTFLVDRALQPCSLVVDCGDCPCELGRGWLDRRTDRLREVLAGVDLVLAPSAVAAEVLAANGVPEDRLSVDENGLADIDLVVRGASVVSPADPTGDAAPVRFLYTGGGNPLKGAAVVADVVARLADVPGWTLTAHGLPPDLVDRLPAGSPVEVRPPFAPDQRDTVFAAADVLLLPSLMRESHSLVTREALQRGLPVICTDSLGPEEVVEDRVNGLVVPAGDPETLVTSLAAAMRSLVDDRARLRGLRQGASTGVAVRSLDDQVAGLAAGYERLIRTGATPTPTRVRRVCFVVGIEGAPLRYRALLPAEALGLVDVASDLRWYRDPDLTATALAADAVVFYRVPATVEVLDLIDRIRERGRPVLFDVDDLIFDPDLAAEIPALSLLPADEAELWLDGVHRYRTTLEASDVFVGSTDGLVAHAAAVAPGLATERFANGVGLLGARMAEQALRRGRRPGPLRIGYLSGTTTHDHDWRYVAPAVADVLAGRPDVELWLGGWVPEADVLAPFAHRTRRLGFVPWPRLPRLLAALDVNLAPLEVESRFNQAKSAIKWLEAALVATPTVASPTQPFVEALAAGGAGPAETGVLAPDLESWVEGIGRLLDDEGERHLMGERARRAALLEWSPHRQGQRYQALLERAAADVSLGGDRRRTAWEPVAPSEPTEPYAHTFPAPDRVAVPWARRAERARAVAAARAERARRRAHGLEARAGDLLAAEGLLGPVRGAVRLVGRSLKR